MRSIVVLVASISTLACVAAPPPAGRWEGMAQIPGRDLPLVVDLAQDPSGAWIGSMIIPGFDVKGAPLGNIEVTGERRGVRRRRRARSAARGPATFTARLDRGEPAGRAAPGRERRALRAEARGRGPGRAAAAQHRGRARDRGRSGSASTRSAATRAMSRWTSPTTRRRRPPSSSSSSARRRPSCPSTSSPRTTAYCASNARLPDHLRGPHPRRPAGSSARSCRGRSRCPWSCAAQRGTPHEDRAPCPPAVAGTARRRGRRGDVSRRCTRTPACTPRRARANSTA